ncbi:helix-turn-helix transcriptional regulator [Pseudomonas aeruginosa]|uniref:helix-turn-helix transcriptional regulator n=1 Tax=Pseudomonas aeruginosa TaxID=287 RepID=UPI00053DBC6B|nr:AlpA family transcriptional regulator [Pseudomonas aeruginosa]NRS71925.1 AlpA family transcriptional regulator [Pseudomonas aeruginosa]PHI26112.1 AlpA family transcriptional regulator [Pseudomonas aeruginosa]HBP0834740.1 AlpA family transcriptional regulator [Pseudomonas aeruginosa]HEJ5943264.1 AlpA family transcriptional regulator [Pseudomonas aeruginosa]
MVKKEPLPRIIRLRDVVGSTGLARSTIYKLIGAGTFPKPVPLTSRSVGWVESEVYEWIQARIAYRDFCCTSKRSN